ncbi:MAG: DUF2325 domain-containing protein [Pseudomonadota bacterium]
MRDNVACSVVGTCLSDKDLQGILKRVRLKPDPGLPSYELHAFFVQSICEDGAVARGVQKLLDRRHEGIVRRIGREQCPEALEKIWEDEYRSGRISGVYWALNTHAHIPNDLHVRAFGEVHMLSHILGRALHVEIESLDAMKARIDDLEALLQRARRRHIDSVSKRDERIRDLETRLLTTAGRELAQNSDGIDAVGALRQGRSGATETAKHTRALLSARQRARQAESETAKLMQEVERLKRQNWTLSSELHRLNDADADRDDCPGAAACQLNLPKDERLRILYLGGRESSIEQLKLIAERAAADFYHHDGGVEESFHKIEPLISKCHVVFCPLDCISHRACLHAKGQCKREAKNFVTLPSAGQTTFARALRNLTGAIETV